MEQISEYAGQYVAYVKEAYRAALRIDPGAVLLIEQRLDLSEWLDEGYGTADALLCYGGVLEVFDLKYGMGVEVQARGNTQMRIYALGALLHFCDMEIDTVTMHIVQPRKNNFDTEMLSRTHLEGWGESVLLPAVAATRDEGAPAVGGVWCRFCKDKLCLSRASAAMSVVASAKREGRLTADMLGRDILPRLSMIEAWVKDVKAEALLQAQAGETIPGYAVKEGVKRRTVTDPAGLALRLTELGLPRESFVEEKLLPLSRLERAVGKKEFAALSEPYIERIAASPRLVRAESEEWRVESEEWSDIFDDFDFDLLQP